MFLSGVNFHSLRPVNSDCSIERVLGTSSKFFVFVVKGVASVASWKSPKKSLFVELVRGVHSTKGDFWFSWSDPSPRKGIFEFRGVTLVHERGFLSFVECTPRKGFFDFRGVTQVHERGFLSFMECTPRKGISEFRVCYLTSGRAIIL